MSQTSTERLREYLAQLPPQAQALLMREFERAIERGEDVAVANFVLEQLRKVVRGTEEDDYARPRTDDPARLLFRPLEPFLVESNFPLRPGQIRRTSLLPVWQWLRPRRRARRRTRIRSGSGRDPADRFDRRARSCGPQIPDSPPPRRSSRLPPRCRATTSSARLPASARPTWSRICCRSARCCGPARRWKRSATGSPASCGRFRKPRLRSVTTALNVPSLQTPQMLPFALSLVMQRLAAPWQIIRLAIKMAASDDEIRVAATPYGVAVTIALHDLSFLAACLRTDIRRGHFDNVAEQLKILHDGVRGLRTELDLRNDFAWGRQLTSIRADISNSLQSEIESVPGRVRRMLRQRADKDIAAAAKIDPSRGRGNRRADRFRRGVPHLCQRTCDQRGDAADLFRSAALRRAIHRGAGAVAARRRRQGARVPADAGQGGDPLLRGPVRPRLRVADEPSGRKCRDRQNANLEHEPAE